MEDTTITGMTMKAPTQCCLWNKDCVDLIDLDLESTQTYTSGAHLKRNLLRCRECGQLYFHEWYEHVSFRHSSYEYDTYIPVVSQDEIDMLLKAKTSADLLKFTPQLHGSYVNDAESTLRWIKEDGAAQGADTVCP